MKIVSRIILLLILKFVLRKALAICRNMCALGYYCDFRGWQKGDSGEYMGDQGSGRRGKAKCWRLDRGSLVKKVWLANIWGSGGSVRWTAGRDALARAQKTGGRPGGNTPVSKVSESARKRTRTRIFVLLSEWLADIQKVVGDQMYQVWHEHPILYRTPTVPYLLITSFLDSNDFGKNKGWSWFKKARYRRYTSDRQPDPVTILIALGIWTISRYQPLSFLCDGSHW